jgi:hypothetical protein
MLPHKTLYFWQIRIISEQAPEIGESASSCVCWWSRSSGMWHFASGLATQNHMSGDLDLQQHHCENLKHHTALSVVPSIIISVT